MSQHHRRLLLLAAMLLAPAASAATLDQVLAQLREEIAAEPASESAPVDAVFARHRDSTIKDIELGAGNTPPRRPVGIDDQDWQALTRVLHDSTPAAADADTGPVRARLIDLNGDGRNALVLDTYDGGTGLFTEIHAGRRDSHHGFVMAQDGDGSGANWIINGRGSDQALYWLRIDGRSYAAYRNSDYFGDTITINRPFSADPAERDPPRELEVRYSYRHRIRAGTSDDTDRPDAARLEQDHALIGALNQQLARLDFDADGQQHTPDPALYCPAASSGQSVAQGSEQDWSWHDAGSDDVDTIADFRVIPDRRCYGASLIAFRSSGLQSLDGCCQLRLYDAPGNEVAAFALHTRRWQVGVAIVPAHSTLR